MVREREGEPMKRAAMRSDCGSRQLVSAAAVATSTMARPRWFSTSGWKVARAITGHATHGMTGQDRIGDISGLEDEGEVAGQRGGIERGGPPGRCAVSALVVEHDPVAGLDQTAGDRDPHSVAGGPAVGKHHGWAAPDVPRGEASTVGRRDGDLTRWFELAPAQILEPIGSSADLRPGLTAGLGAPVGDGTRGGNGRRAAQDDEATMSK